MRLLFLYILLFTSTNIFTQDLPADKLATKETIQLFHNLKLLNGAWCNAGLIT